MEKLDWIPKWKEVDARSWAERVPPGLSRLDRLVFERPDEFARLGPVQVLQLKYSPEACLRPDQMMPAGDWDTWLVMPARGWGKTHACASTVLQWVLTNTVKDAVFALIAPTLPEVDTLQWQAIKAQIPPWVQYVERLSSREVVFPNHNCTIRFFSGHLSEFRGPNLRGAWGDEVLKWQGGEDLYRNVKFALRIRGPRPPVFILSTTPPLEPNWILKVACETGTFVTRGRMRDNYTLDPKSIAGMYREAEGTPRGARELEGEVVLSVEGSLSNPELIDQFRVDSAPDGLDRIVVSVDPTQTAGPYSDQVGIVAVAIKAGHLYVLDSWIRQASAEEWSTRAVEMALLHNASRFVAEVTGVGAVGHSLTATAQIMGHAGRWPVELQSAKESKERRADALSVLIARGRVHIVGRQAMLESEITTWSPGMAKRWSPGGLDALVHAANYLTHGMQRVQSNPQPAAANNALLTGLRSTRRGREAI